MLGSAPFIGFLPVRDLDAARAFYVDTLGLTLKEQTPGGLVLDAGGTMLRVAAVPDLAPRAFTVAGWRVVDLDQLVDQLGEAGVVTLAYESVEQDARGIWNAPNGDRVAWFGDPDGNVLSLTQFEGAIVDEFWV
jgi:catechol 2,3-dioxygenase-like lactoylglutathione lyase family enzyme